MTLSGNQELPLEVRGLTVRYGSARGVEGVDLSVPTGQVTGLLGPNGAGKTTLLRACLDLVHPTSGEIQIFGVDSRDPRARREVTYLPGDLVLPARLTGRAALRRFTAGRGPLDVNRVQGLAERLGLDLGRPIGQLSKGNRQKVGLMLAFAPRARLLLLDEPTSGLDPLLQREFADLVHEATTSGASVILSSHVLSELEHLADRVAVLRSGALAAVEGIGELRDRAQRIMRITCVSEAEAEALLQDLSGVAASECEGTSVRVRYSGDVDPIVKASARYSIRTIDSSGSDIDEVLLDFYQEGES